MADIASLLSGAGREAGGEAASAVVYVLKRDEAAMVAAALTRKGCTAPRALVNPSFVTVVKHNSTLLIVHKNTLSRTLSCLLLCIACGSTISASSLSNFVQAHEIHRC